MIDIFNTPEFLNPQMDYLYFLQNLRLALPRFVSEFFQGITTLGESLFTVSFMAVIYWCINKKYGEFIILCSSFGYCFNQLLKLTFCIYRPWILDSRIVPYEKALPAAYGYSFPSGHTTSVTLNFGGAALCFKSFIFRIFCLLIVLCVAFSRNFLGVHSLQDVVIAFFNSLIILFLMKWLFDRFDLKDNKIANGIFTSLMLIFCILFLVYIKFKSYPMDYVDGNLLVDPLAMQKGAFKSTGILIGCVLGTFIERHFIDFQISENIYKRLAEGIVGLSFIYVYIKYISKFFVSILGTNIGYLIALIILGLFITAIYPLIMKKLNYKKEIR